MKYFFLVIITLFILTTLLDRIIRIFKTDNIQSVRKKKKYLLFSIILLFLGSFSYLVAGLIYSDMSYAVYAAICLFFAFTSLKHRKLISK